MKFSKKYRARVKDSDLGGHQYFVNVLNLSHDLLEDFVIESEIGWKTWFDDPKVVAPIVGTETSYQASIYPGQDIDASLEIEKIGNSSVVFNFQLSQNERLCSSVKIVFVFFDKEKGQKTNIPEQIKAVLERYCPSI